MKSHRKQDNKKPQALASKIREGMHKAAEVAGSVIERAGEQIEEAGLKVGEAGERMMKAGHKLKAENGEAREEPATSAPQEAPAR